MLGLGWTEMLVVGVVALIVIGPKELPDLMRKLGRFAGTVRRMGSDFQRELNRTTGLDEVKNLRSAITQPLKDTTDAIRREFNTTTASGKVEPSGAIKPTDPKVESVVGEIRQKAGLPFTPAAAAAMAAREAEAAAEPKPEVQSTPRAKAASKRAPRAKAAPTAPVASADLPPPGTSAPEMAPGTKAKKPSAAAKSATAKSATAKSAATKSATGKVAMPKAAKSASPAAAKEGVADTDLKGKPKVKTKPTPKTKGTPKTRTARKPAAKKASDG